MLRPDSTNQNNAESNVINSSMHRNFSHSIEILNHVVDALGAFKHRYDRKFNFSELSKYLKIPNADINDLISLILNFQEKYETVFNNYHLKKKIMNNKFYLIAERNSEQQLDSAENVPKTPNIITMKRDHAKLLSDIIYIFQYVKRGKAFDLNSSDSTLLKNLKIMKDTHPYLFYYNGNGLIYPSEIGLQLGNLIHSYNKSNKKIKNLVIENTTIVFD